MKTPYRDNVVRWLNRTVQYRDGCSIVTGSEKNRTAPSLLRKTAPRRGYVSLRLNRAVQRRGHGVGKDPHRTAPYSVEPGINRAAPHCVKKGEEKTAPRCGFDPLKQV